jgi:hypothetical protein
VCTGFSCQATITNAVFKSTARYAESTHGIQVRQHTGLPVATCLAGRGVHMMDRDKASASTVTLPARPGPAQPSWPDKMTRWPLAHQPADRCDRYDQARCPHAIRDRPGTRADSDTGDFRLYCTCRYATRSAVSRQHRLSLPSYGIVNRAARCAVRPALPENLPSRWEACMGRARARWRRSLDARTGPALLLSSSSSHWTSPVRARAGPVRAPPPTGR